MGKEKELVEVKIRVPKRLVEVLERENYLGWKPEDFFEAAIKSGISITVNNMTFEEGQEFYKKYGKNVDVLCLRSTRVVDC